MTRRASVPLSVLLLTLAACGPGERSESPSAEVRADSPRIAAETPAPPPVPASAATIARAARWNGPPEPYADWGVCPFECCVYGEWRARAPLAVYARERDTTRVAFTLAAGEAFTGVSGTVHLDRVGVVRVRQPVEYGTADRPRRLEAGDTVYVLSHVGEGHFRVWHRGQVIEGVPGFWGDRVTPGGSRTPGELLRAPEPHWWARVRDRRGRTGWIYMQRDAARVGKVDACGGPEA